MNETSHSLFIATNYIPVVNETDHGTWRRLLLLVFRLTFRKPGEALTGPTDRRGDPKLKARMKAGTDGQHDAVVTWAVEGARRWYTSGFPAVPPTVEADTRAWRKEADRILALWDECLIPDREACVLTTDLHAAFNAWMTSNGHNEWSRELFAARFTGHAETAKHHIEERRPRNLDGHSISRWPGARAELPQRPYVYVGVRFRGPGDLDENTEESGGRSERSDPMATLSHEADHGKVAERVDHSDQGRHQAATTGRASRAATGAARWAGRRPGPGEPPLGISREAWASLQAGRARAEGESA
jgi:phage/plasmid-associated DNA primase